MSPYLESIIVIASVNILVALGMYVSFISGQISAVHAALMGLGGYVAGYFSEFYSMNLWLALAAGTLSGGLIAGIASALLLRLNEFYFAIATLALSETFVTIANNSDFIGGAEGLSGVPLRVGVTLPVVCVVIVVAVVRHWEKSAGGLKARACGEDRVAAASSGVDVTWTRIKTFVFGGLLCGLAGSLLVHNVGVMAPANMSFLAEVMLLVYIGIGGMRSYTGAILGASVVTVMPEVLRFSVYDRYLIFGLALAAILLIRPYGLLPRFPVGRRPVRSVLRKWTAGTARGVVSGPKLDS